MFTSASFSHLQKFGNTGFGIGTFVTADNGYRKLNDQKFGRLNVSLMHRDKKNKKLSYGINLNAGRTADTDFLLWENADSGALKQNPATAQEFTGNFLTIDPFITLNSKDQYKHDLKIRFQSSQNMLPENENNNSNAVNLYSEYQLWYRLLPVMDINSGFSGNYNRINSNFHGDHEGLNLAGYTQLDLRPSGRLKIIAGLRIEHNTLDGNRDAPVPIFRTGINYRIAGYTFLRASFGQGYRYPSVAEKYASTTVGSIIIIPNPYIMPEKGWSTELGIKQGLMKGNLTGQADMSVFYSQNENLIEYIFSSYEYPPGSGTSSYGFRATNVEHSRVYGFELEYAVNAAFTKFSTSLSGGYLFIYPVEFNEYTLQNTGEFLKYRRKHAAKLSIGNEYGNFEMGLDLYVKSKILNIDDVFLNEATRESFLPGFYDYWMNDNNPYLLMDTSFGYRLNENYTVSVAVKNLTNTEYMGRPGDIQPQRNYSLRFTGRF
jgi:iron complex outermembrane receptor protein